MKISEMLKAAGFDESKIVDFGDGTCDIEPALERFDSEMFCTLYLDAVNEPVQANAVLGGALDDAVRAVLKEGAFPTYHAEDDRGLEESEYVEFVKAVLGKLVDQTGVEETLN